jgi:AcrR family transcriptional regulator
VRSQSNEAGEHTRLLLMAAGERLFAEQGVGVSTRDIGKAAGQSNKSAVGYHFGSRDELVLAITRHHDRDIVQRREAMMQAVSKHGSLVDWLGCTVRPITDHLASLGTPSWYARFLAGCINDPSLRDVVFADAITQASMQTLLTEVNQRLPALPASVFEARGAMTQHVIVSTCASHERALQLGAPTPFASWAECCEVTIDALVGLWRAPVRGHSQG